MSANGIVVILLLLSALAGVAVLVYYSKRPYKYEVEDDEKSNFVPPSALRHIDQIVDYEDIKGGIIYRKGRCYGLARLEGLNFSVMSQDEQNSREIALTEIFNSIDYPVQFITTTTVADTSSAAQEVAVLASMLRESPLKNYMVHYAGALQQMKQERRVISQQVYMVISSDGGDGPPEQVIRERMEILTSSFLHRVNLCLTPLLSTEDVLNVLQQIMLPNQLISVRERTNEGVCAPLHYSVRDISSSNREDVGHAV